MAAITRRTRWRGKRGTDVLVTGCLIAKDEEPHIGRCLSSLEGLADEVVVVDTGSTDRTIEIAKSFGARVVVSPWRNDFSYHRNESLTLAKGRWLIAMDADHEVVDTDKNETRKRLVESDGELPKVLMVRETVKYGGGVSFDMFSPRIFRAAAGFRYVYRVHEQLRVGNCKAMLSNVKLVHHGYIDNLGLGGKERRNLSLAQQMPDDDPHALHCRVRAAISLMKWDEALKAAKDLLALAPRGFVKIEGCVLGAACAFNLKKKDDLAFFLCKAEEVATDTPDVAFVRLLSAAQGYADALSEGDSETPGTYLRPWMFRHSKRRAESVLAALLGTPGTNGKTTGGRLSGGRNDA